MATWGDIEKMTWDQLEGLNWHQIETMTGDQVDRYVNELWPLLRSLNQEERKELVSRFLDETLPVLTAGGSPIPRLYEVALQIWQLVAPKNRQDAIAMTALLVAILSLMNDLDDEMPPPDVHIHIENHFEAPFQRGRRGEAPDVTHPADREGHPRQPDDDSTDKEP